jgi:holo-[acyl-carrier protein] synthase
VRVGVDLIEIERIRRALAQHGETFKERCFTPAERAYCDSKPNPPQHYAGRFAAKEAVGKALGSGVYFTWKEIEIRGRPKPGVHLAGRTAAWARRVGIARVELSMTHSRELAAAVAVTVDEMSGVTSPTPEPGLARREANRR